MNNFFKAFRFVLTTHLAALLVLSVLRLAQYLYLNDFVDATVSNPVWPAFVRGLCRIPRIPETSWHILFAHDVTSACDTSNANKRIVCKHDRQWQASRKRNRRRQRRASATATLATRKRKRGRQRHAMSKRSRPRQRRDMRKCNRQRKRHDVNGTRTDDTKANDDHFL